jgi:uncharacterized protein
MYSRFEPSLFIRGALAQTIVGSLKFRLPKKSGMMLAQKEKLLQAGVGIRLQGFHSKQANGASRGLVILIHGWEGSANSTYIQRTGNFLYDHGYDIFRLNLRDHGDTHNLNIEPFNGSLIDETYAAVYQAAVLARGIPVFLAGFSLGGNFTLRIAARTSRVAKSKKIPNLAHCFAVSPALNPHDATLLMDSHGLLGKYFLKKWRRSLQKKQSAHPREYDFAAHLQAADVMQLTQSIIPELTKFKTTREYFDSYTLLEQTLMGIRLPTTILTSKDDPIIRVSDFYRLHLNRYIRLLVENFGGHNGFIQSLKLDPWYLQLMLDAFQTDL